MVFVFTYLLLQIFSLINVIETLKMELTDIMLGLFVAILGISTTSIGINYFNKAKFSDGDKCVLSSCKTNRNFLIVMLVVSLLVAGGLFYEGSKYTNKFKAARTALL